MLEPEYTAGFGVLRKQTGLWCTMKVVSSTALESLKKQCETKENLDETGRTKARIKNRFVLLALIHKELQNKHGAQRTNEIMHEVVMKGGQVFLRGFARLGPRDDFTDSARTYKEFERRNIVFDVVHESKDKFEIVVRRCLVYESFRELGIGDLTRWLCDIAYAYFESYHPRVKHVKDRMIARGDDTCHEIFAWQD